MIPFHPKKKEYMILSLDLWLMTLASGLKTWNTRPISEDVGQIKGVVDGDCNSHQDAVVALSQLKELDTYFYYSLLINWPKRKSLWERGLFRWVGLTHIKLGKIENDPILDVSHPICTSIHWTLMSPQKSKLQCFLFHPFFLCPERKLKRL